MSRFQERYGPWALIAGASEGLGAAFAHEIAARGLNVVLIARRKELLENLQEELTQQYGVETRVLPLDLSQPNPIEQIEEATRDLEIGLLVYNAAYSLIGPFLSNTPEDHLKEIDVNCRGPLLLSHYFGAKFAQQKRGGIILLSSLTGFQGSPLIANYAATKAYNLVLGEGLADEFRENNVDVLVSCAGAIRTPNYEASNPASDGSVIAPVLEPKTAAQETLNALGKQPLIIPGKRIRLASWILRRLLPRKLATAIMGKNTKAMYRPE